MINLSFISIPLIFLMVVFSGMWLVYAFVAAAVPYPKVKRNGKNPLISIIIPANNEETVIEQCIRNFAAQTYKNLELIIVCHNCTDNTYPIAKKAAEHFSEIKVKVIDFKTKKSGKGLALDKGLEEAKGELFAYFDADSLTDCEFFENALKYIDSGYHCLQSKIVARNPNDNFLTKIQGYEMLVFSMIFFEARYKLGLNSGIGGTGVIIKTEIMKTIGGFKNSLVDDLYACMELTKRGYKIAFANDCIVYDEKPLTWSGAFKQRTRWIKGHFEVLFDRFWEVIKRPHDLLYLLCPTVVIALWISLGLGLFYIYQVYVLKTILVTYYGITVKNLAILTVPYAIQFFVGVAKEEGKLKAIKTVSLYAIPLYCWSFIWYLVIFRAMFVKSWEETKTTHVGIGGNANE